MALADILHEATQQRNALRHDTQDSSVTVKPPKPKVQNGHKLHFADIADSPPQDSPSLRHSQEMNDEDRHRLRPDQLSKSFSRLSGLRTPPDTPSARTGPPRSLSFAYGHPGSPAAGRSANKGYDFSPVDAGPDTSIDDPELAFTNDNDFRGALEYQDRKGKKREKSADDSWNPIRWFQESPKEEKAGMDFPSTPSAQAPNPESGDEADGEADLSKSRRSDGNKQSSTSPSRLPKRGASVNDSDQVNGATGKASTSALRRAFSIPQRTDSETKGKNKEKNKDGEVTDGRATWAKLRSLLPQLVHPDESILPGPSTVTSHAVNITDELITGGLAMQMFKLWFERDEKGHRRVPVLLHRLRIRISDSLHPMQGHRSVFRIECEYANGAARWVVYRELRDFVSLHAHYTVSNVYNRNVDNMPEFPKTSEFLSLRLLSVANVVL